ncbi:hypothetical protein U2261_18885 [Achromobacter xylosoxidans]|uniref:hypothetical protein n=1 Tax=Alcaligenes xylosoxydans xylosoxydans TaxID=85698 RepID=UPI002ACA3299|nr:hypothetical protein [Achromobacter xylosoxidans]MDZ5616688.1 hypothetical protein [Achromobacter xylosoxidans]MDZ5626090.1 hypothetical protein [Achromobacter xylosoxidans]MDZ5686848.1 hypothetical protein [Achromobacter xylosoxidans]
MLPVSLERKLLSEISRLHGVLIDMRALADTVEKTWAEGRRSKLVAIHRMRLLLDEEPTIAGGKFSNSKNNLPI